ncbi:autotransporter family protein [Pseudomonas frederiksbergensis]|uniref:autotransporter family protein n=1 Tax=Pseudomonas frederiksbergensis TaxID=104087 RepID=UPI000F47FA5F|nr:autotransporter outer membrane beta-barrel domain-containing protein [Pseudomonas frederiksbergensis]RON43998.1 autotransporter outer membrane beta-barrel domain-containing protein [Pseudomonas frederiksbergensis]
MNTSCLRRSLLALSVAAATIHGPGVQAATFNYDVGTGPLVNYNQYYDFVNLTGSANVVQTSPSALTSAAQFTTLTTNYDVTNKATITIDGATHGVGILTSRGTSPWPRIGNNLVNQGSITVNGLADIGDSIGMADNGNQIVGNFINSSDITVTGNNATGVSLIGSRLGKGVINDGTISVSGTNAHGIYLENTTQTLPVYNSKSITATGANAEALTLKGATFNVPAGVNTSSIANSGTLSGESIGIHVSNQAVGKSLSINQFSGLIEGGKAAIQVDDGASYLYWSNGDIKGDVLGLSGVLIRGEANFDGSTIKAGYVTIEAGQLTLVKPHTTINGDFDMEEADSVLVMSLGNDTDVNRPVLTVTGTSDIAPGAHLQLQARSSDFQTASGGTRYTLIRSGQLLGGENLAVESTSALLQVKSYGVEGNDVKALVSTKPDEVVAQNTLDAGGSKNAADAVAEVSTGLMDKVDERDPVFQAFANATTNAELAKLAEKLGPDVSRGVLHATTNSQTLVANAINERSSRARTDRTAPEKGVWLQALTSDANQDARRGVAGYDADSHGIAVGADGQLNANTAVGVAYSYLDTDVKADTGNKTQVTGHALTLYGNWTHDNWFVDTSLMYGWNDNESKRYIAGTQAKGNFDSDIYGVNALAGYSFRLDRSVVLEPQIGARYASVKMDAYREKGSSASLNVDSQRYEVGEMGVGARLAAAFDVGTGSFEPEAKVMAWHDFIGDKTATTSAFVLGGDSFTTRGTTPVRDSYEVGLGANYVVGAWSVGGSYNYVTSTDFNADTFTAKVRYAF